MNTVTKSIYLIVYKRPDMIDQLIKYRKRHSWFHMWPIDDFEYANTSLPWYFISLSLIELDELHAFFNKYSVRRKKCHNKYITRVIDLWGNFIKTYTY